MAGDVANPRIWLNADVLDAPLGSTGPTTVSAPWDAAFKTVGLLSEDGLTESRDEDQTDHYAYGGILVRITRSKHKRTMGITVLEDNLVVFGLVNPGSTAVTAAGVTTRTIKVPSSNIRAMGLELADGAIKKRIVIPRCEVSEVGERTYSDNEMAMNELTITIYPDSSRVLYKEITDDPQAAVV